VGKLGSEELCAAAHYSAVFSLGAAEFEKRKLCATLLLCCLAPEGRKKLAQGVTCPDAFYREPWDSKAPTPFVPPPPPERGRG
jgi:hypothetical protein